MCVFLAGWLAGWHGLILRLLMLPVSGSTEVAANGGGSVRQIPLRRWHRSLWWEEYGVWSTGMEHDLGVELCDMATWEVCEGVWLVLLMQESGFDGGEWCSVRLLLESCTCWESTDRCLLSSLIQSLPWLLRSLKLFEAGSRHQAARRGLGWAESGAPRRGPRLCCGLRQQTLILNPHSCL